MIENKIFLVRGKKVMFDRDLAVLYGVETKALNRAVKRNIERFPEDFIFQLSKEEVTSLRFHFGTSSWGGQRYLPYAFTENGVAMLSSVLNTPSPLRGEGQGEGPMIFPPLRLRGGQGALREAIGLRGVMKGGEDFNWKR